jgi:hypothetical protein
VTHLENQLVMDLVNEPDLPAALRMAERAAAAGGGAEPVEDSGHPTKKQTSMW